MDLVTMGMLILAVSIVMMAYLEGTQLMMKKLEVSQVSRRYILKMETEGYLTPQNKEDMLRELYDIGMKNIDVTGTTLQPVSYGDTIMLKIKGTINVRMREDAKEVWENGFRENQIPMEETRMSTAKN